MNRYMVFDVESAGLHGEGFAWGYVVMEDGVECEACYGFVDEVPPCSEEDRAWVESNVLAAMDRESTYYRADSLKELRANFWEHWMRWKAKGAQLVTDCGWPVEANFLSACIADDPYARKWDGPYPLLDLSSVLLAARLDPVGTFDRLPNEMPAHDPLRDARQSARVLIETLSSLP